jgi:hypothetical protein
MVFRLELGRPMIPASIGLIAFWINALFPRTTIVVVRRVQIRLLLVFPFELGEPRQRANPLLEVSFLELVLVWTIHG